MAQNPREPKSPAELAEDLRLCHERVRELEDVVLKRPRSRDLLDSLPAGVLFLNPDTGKIVDVNPIAAHMFGTEARNIVGRDYSQFIALTEEDRDNRVDDGEEMSSECDLIRADGSRRAIVKTRTVVPLGGRPYVLESFLDITRRKRAERELEVQRNYLEKLIEAAPEAIAVLDVDGLVVKINNDFTTMFGFESGEAVGQAIDSLIVPPEMGDKARAITDSVSSGQGIRFESERLAKDGSRIQVSVVGTPIQGEDGPVGVYAIYRDISQQKAAELERERLVNELEKAQSELRRLAIQDSLTGLANRCHFDEMLEENWLRARRDSLPLGLILVDVDHFKAFNDTSGIAAGDECLRRVASALAGCLRRPGDLVARYGGDEFVCLLPNTVPKGVQRIADIMSQTVDLLDLPHPASPVADHVTVSVGAVSGLVEQFANIDALLAVVDRALTKAKSGEGNRIELADIGTPAMGYNMSGNRR